MASQLDKDRPKTVNPLDAQWRFCQYWPRECNLTADFYFTWVWHPQIGQSQSWDHYQPIRFWVFLVLAPSNQPITELVPLSTDQILGLLGKWVRKKTLSLLLSKLPLCGSDKNTSYKQRQNWKKFFVLILVWVPILVARMQTSLRSAGHAPSCDGIMKQEGGTKLLS